MPVGSIEHAHEKSIFYYNQTHLTIFLIVRQEDRCGATISVKALEIALQQCELWLRSKEHEDIDLKKAVSLSLFTYMMSIINWGGYFYSCLGWIPT